MSKAKFIQELKAKYQTCSLPTSKVEIDWHTVEMIDVDLRNILDKKNSGKRYIVFKAMDAKTKKTVVFAKPLCDYNARPTTAINKSINLLLKIGYRLHKSKTLLCALLDLHNPNTNNGELMKVKIATKLVK